METKIPAPSRSPSHRWQWLASEEHCALQTWDPSKLQSKVYVAPGPNTHTYTHRYSGNWSFKKQSFSWLWHSLTASIQFHLNFFFKKKILFFNETAQDSPYGIHNSVMVPTHCTEITVWKHCYSGYCFPFSLPGVFSTCPQSFGNPTCLWPRGQCIGPSLRFSVLSWSRNSIFCWVAELGRCDLGLFEEEKREITN